MTTSTSLKPPQTGDEARWIQRYRAGRGDRRITIRVTSETYNYLNSGKFSRRQQLMWRYWIKINLIKDDSLPFRQFRVFDRKNVNEIILES